MIRFGRDIYKTVDLASDFCFPILMYSGIVYFVSFQLKFNSRTRLSFKLTGNELKMEETALAQPKPNLLKTKAI